MGCQLMGVVTADVVRSRFIKPQYYEAMLYTLEMTLSRLTEIVPMQYDIFRGDSFQCVCKRPADAVKVAVIISLALKTLKSPIKVRQSIGVGEVTLLRGKVKSSIGEAFILSGEGLESMKGRFLTVSSNNFEFQERVELLTEFLDITLEKITRAQAEVLYEYMCLSGSDESRSHDHIAKLTGKTRSNVTKLLNASYYRLMDKYILYFEGSLIKAYE